MSTRNTLLSILVLTVTVGWAAAAWAQEGVLFKVAMDADNTYCHMRFPAMQEETLSWDRPLLKDASEGDIIDFYGPCNHEPLGRTEIQSQRHAYTRDLNRDYDSDDGDDS